MQKLSVALATHNEEKNLARCLDSVVGLVSEIVIVDGQSTDKTQEIAKLYKAKVIVKPNQTNFHINKQAAIDSCTNEWILQLDADEVVSNGLKKEIEEILKKDTLNRKDNRENSPNGYYIPRKNWFLGRFLMKGGQYPDYTLRLYRKGKGKLPQKDVHEQAVVEGEVSHLKQALYHYPYKNFSEYMKKWNRYCAFEASLFHERLKNKSFVKKAESFIKYVIFMPIYWFLLTYIRHKGFMDLWPGFVFSFFSALRYPTSFIIYITRK